MNANINANRSANNSTNNSPNIGNGNANNNTASLTEKARGHMQLALDGILTDVVSVCRSCRCKDEAEKYNRFKDEAEKYRRLLLDARVNAHYWKEERDEAITQKNELAERLARAERELQSLRSGVATPRPRRASRTIRFKNNPVTDTRYIPKFNNTTPRVITNGINKNGNPPDRHAIWPQHLSNATNNKYDSPARRVAWYIIDAMECYRLNSKHDMIIALNDLNNYISIVEPSTKEALREHFDEAMFWLDNPEQGFIKNKNYASAYNLLDALLRGLTNMSLKDYFSSQRRKTTQYKSVYTDVGLERALVKRLRYYIL